MNIITEAQHVELLAYGLCDSGDGRPYMGYVCLADLEDVHGKFNSP
jgi:Protein of unknown function (DUF2958)